MSKICTSQEQSKKLVELGIDVNTADMYYDVNSYGIQSKPEVAIGKIWSKDIPAWSLTALIGLGAKFSLENCDEPVDAAFVSFCWLKKIQKNFGYCPQ